MEKSGIEGISQSVLIQEPAEPSFNEELVISQLKPRKNYDRFKQFDLAFIRCLKLNTAMKFSSLNSHMRQQTGLRLDDHDLKMLNGLLSNSSLQAGRSVLFLDFTCGKGEAARVEDLSNGTLESGLQKLNFPIFLASYTVNHSFNVPGYLMLGSTGICFKSFVPTALKEACNPAVDNHFDFSISYNDINPNSIYKTPVPSSIEDDEEYNIEYNIQIGAYNNGKRHTYKSERYQLIEEFKKRGIVILTVNISLYRYRINGERLSNSDKESVADHIIKVIQEKQLNFFANDEYKDLIGSSKIDALASSGENSKDVILTSIPNYDICYEEIFPVLEKQESSKLHYVNKHLHLIRDLFDIRHIRNVVQISNTSLFSIKSTFPELFKKVTVEDIEDRQGYHSYVVRSENNDLMDEPSRIIRSKNSRVLLNHLPGYVKTCKWYLAFDRFSDGSSLSNMIRLLKFQPQVMFLILDDKDSVFGGFFDGVVKNTGGKYAGTGECFLFSWNCGELEDEGADVLEGQTRESTAVHRETINLEDDWRLVDRLTKIGSDVVEEATQGFECFHSTRANDFFFFCGEEGFGMGSDPHYGLFVANNLLDGSTHYCKTFDNKSLTKKHHFKIKKLEVWGFTPG